MGRKQMNISNVKKLPWDFKLDWVELHVTASSQHQKRVGIVGKFTEDQNRKKKLSEKYEW